QRPETVPPVRAARLLRRRADGGGGVVVPEDGHGHPVAAEQRFVGDGTGALHGPEAPAGADPAWRGAPDPAAAGGADRAFGDRVSVLAGALSGGAGTLRDAVEGR